MFTPVRVLGIAFAVLVGASLGVACEPAPLYTGDLEGPRVALIGDSIANTSRSEIHQHLDQWWAVGIKAVPARRIEQAQPDADLFASTDGGPAAVVIALGTNDAVQGWPIADSAAALRAMIASLPSARCIPVVNVGARTLSTSINAWATEWNASVLPAVASEDQRVVIVDWDGYLAWRYSVGSPEGGLTSDLIHPTPVGREAWATLIDDALARCRAAPTASNEGPPEAPTFVLAAAGDGAATVAWTPPPDRGASLTGYVITPYVEGVAADEQSFENTSDPRVVTGLANGTAYTFTVAAVSERGRGPDSEPSGPVVVGIPGPPALVVGEPGDASISLRWTPAAPNGGPVTGYVVTPRTGGVDLEPVHFASPATSQVLAGLDNGHSYVFAVAATNEWGTGTGRVSTRAVVAGSPGAPVLVSATPGGGTATVTWTPGPDNGAPISGALITPFIGFISQAPVTVDDPTTSAEVTGLVEGTTYWFQVVCVNERGPGTPGSSQKVTIGPAEGS